MIDHPTMRTWLYRLLFLGMAGFVIFVRILPMSIGEGRFPGPDLLLCLTFAWVMRRPDYVPALLVAALFLLTDMLFQRPPGLWPAVVLIGVEFLRARDHLSRDLPFLVEWAMVTAVMAMMLLADRLILSIFFIDQVSFGLSVLRLIMTVLTYPAVVFLSTAALGVRKITAAEAEILRQRA
ncbi:rod shape-determining protein MreD [Aliiroseovarius subalbicans]|uniref:rod shape-determining protein MreD n=1 Tax=Aliiroseovarius subalbicans TaxID=2925840 RepID=UPI001F57F10C|nr:rod shape-determining protein MreD [Aliiroseovarius subalbicans]MCI2399347.1 rod shape-determining protein MreD [Aliiroseovarius subalbicans]